MIAKSRIPAVRVLIASALVLAAAAVHAQPARALEIDRDGYFGEGEVVDDDLFLAYESVEMAGTVNGNLIAMGTDVLIRGTVNGDVLAFGSTVRISGAVNGNLISAGGDIIVEGSVRDSLFLGGNTIILGPEGTVGGNLYGGAFSITLSAGSIVERDAFLLGYQAILDGEVKRDVQAALGALEVNGKVGRDVIVDIGEPDEDAEDYAYFIYTPFTSTGRILPPGLHISEEAAIGGKLEYHSAVTQSAGIQAAPEGGVVYHYRKSEDFPKAGEDRENAKIHVIDFGAMFMNYVFGVIRELLTLVLLGALAVWLIPSVLNRAVGTLRAKPLPALVWGGVVLVGGWTAWIITGIIILMLGLAIGVVTLFGLMSSVFGIGFSALGLAGAVFLAVMLYGSKLVVALLIGDLILRLFRKDYSASCFWPLLLGILVMVFVDAIPVLGFLVSFIVILFGLGALWMIFRDWWRTRGAKA
ncbi:MAG: polymer-forming cytoskeletal protein [Anaerolineales bacterium]|nr:polymer-forming cytoskeletal protein [Anaerolineales bacterium]